MADTKLELKGEEFCVSDDQDLDGHEIVVRVSANEVKVVHIWHHHEYQGPGKPLKKWTTEHLKLDIMGEGIEVLED
jgi:hypothetical protein